MIIRRMLLNPDFVQNALGALLTIGSMALSGYFGWLRASSAVIPVQLAAALMCSLIAGTLAWAVVRRERLRFAGVKEVAYKRMSRAVMIFLIANVATDFMATRALFALSAVKTVNVNNDAKLASNEVKDLEDRIKNYKGETAYKTKFDSPSTYDFLISQQKQITDKGRNVFSRTKGCTDTTLEVSSKVCRRIKELEANKENAVRRKVVLSELSALEPQLKEARRKESQNKKTVDVAAEPVNDLTKIVMLVLSPIVGEGKNTMDWGQTLFVMFLAWMFSWGIVYIGAEQGRRLGPMPDYRSFNFDQYVYDEDELPPIQLPAPDGHVPSPVPAQPAAPLIPQGGQQSNVTPFSKPHNTTYQPDTGPTELQKLAQRVLKEANEG